MDRTSDERQKILVVGSYLPWPITYGAAVRTYNLVKELSRHASITMLCYGDSMTSAEDVRWMEQFARVLPPVAPPIGEDENKNALKLQSLFSSSSFTKRQFFSAAMQQRLCEIASRERFDALIVEASFMGFFDFSAFRAPLILDEHNVEYDLFRQTFARERNPLRKLFHCAEYRKFKREEIEIARRFDLLFYPSSVDAAVIARDCDRPIEVIPNGVDIVYFSPAARPENLQPKVLYFGALNYFPNADAVQFFLQEMWPSIRAAAPEAQLDIVGPNPEARIRALNGAQNIAVHGTVPDIRPYLHAADIVVVPLRLGSGTRLKVLESLAAGKAIVTTPVGCEGIDITSGREALIAAAPADFCRATIGLLRDSAARKSLGQQGRAFVEERYNWPKIGDRVAELIARLARSASARPNIEKDFEAGIQLPSGARGEMSEHRPAV